VNHYGEEPYHKWFISGLDCAFKVTCCAISIEDVDAPQPRHWTARLCPLNGVLFPVAGNEKARFLLYGRRVKSVSMQIAREPGSTYVLQKPRVAGFAGSIIPIDDGQRVITKIQRSARLEGVYASD
jgi:hypothetical protein